MTDDEMTKFAEACAAGKTPKRAELIAFMRAYLDRAAAPAEGPAPIDPPAPSFLPPAMVVAVAAAPPVWSGEVVTIPMSDPFDGATRCPITPRDMGGGAVHLSFDANRTYTRGEALGLARAIYTIAAPTPSK